MRMVARRSMADAPVTGPDVAVNEVGTDDTAGGLVAGVPDVDGMVVGTGSASQRAMRRPRRATSAGSAVKFHAFFTAIHFAT